MSRLETRPLKKTRDPSPPTERRRHLYYFDCTRGVLVVSTRHTKTSLYVLKWMIRTGLKWCCRTFGKNDRCVTRKSTVPRRSNALFRKQNGYSSYFWIFFLDFFTQKTYTGTGWCSGNVNGNKYPSFVFDDSRNDRYNVVEIDNGAWTTFLQTRPNNIPF